MTRGFAKKNYANHKSQRLPNVLVFFVGFGLGLFIAFIIYLWRDVPADPAAARKPPTADSIADQPSEVLDYQFYDLFPKREVPIIEELTPRGEKIIVPEKDAFFLQVGSFKKSKDANRQKARLILLSFDAFIKEVEHDGIIWHRVLVGPMASGLALNRARKQLASANIESIQIRIKR